MNKHSPDDQTDHTICTEQRHSQIERTKRSIAERCDIGKRKTACLLNIYLSIKRGTINLPENLQYTLQSRLRGCHTYYAIHSLLKFYCSGICFVLFEGNCTSSVNVLREMLEADSQKVQVQKIITGMQMISSRSENLTLRDIGTPSTSWPNKV